MPTSVETRIHARCRYYRTVCHLPCSVDDAGRIVVTLAAGLRALTTTQRLGAELQIRLLAAGCAGPSIWHRSRRYTFLATYSPGIENDHYYRAGLLATNSLIVGPGATIALPSPGADADYHRWIQPAHNTFRPSIRTVLDTLLDCGRS